MLHGQSFSQPSYRQTVSSKYAGRGLPRRAPEFGEAPSPAKFPPCSSRPLRHRSRVVRTVSSPSAVRLGLCFSRISSATSPLPPPPCLLEPWRRGFSHGESARERIPSALYCAGFQLLWDVSDSASAFSSGVFLSSAPPLQKKKNPGVLRSAGSVRRALPAKRPRGKLFGEI